MAKKEDDDWGGTFMAVCGIIGAAIGFYIGHENDEAINRDAAEGAGLIVGLIGGLLASPLVAIALVPVFLVYGLIRAAIETYLDARKSKQQRIEHQERQARERERQEQERLVREKQIAAQRIIDDEKEADSIVAALRYPSEADPGQERLRRIDELRKSLARHRASLERVRKSTQSPEAVGVAIADIEQRITETDGELTSLLSQHSDPQRQLIVEAAIAQHPNNAHLHLMRAKLLLSEPAQYRRVLADCDFALQRLPRCELAFVYRGIAHHNSDNLAAAASDYQQAIEINPNSWALSCLATLFNHPQVARHQEALHLATRALEADRNLTSPRQQAAIACEKLGDLEQALQHYSGIIATEPNCNVEIRHKRASLLMQLGRNQLALHDAKAILGTGQQNYDTYDLLAQLEPHNPDHILARANLQTDETRRIADLWQVVDACHRKLPGGGTAELERLIIQCNRVSRELGDFREIDQSLKLFEYRNQAILRARQLKEPRLLALALYSGIVSAFRLGLYEKCITWALELLPASANLPPGFGLDQQGRVELLAYIMLIHSLTYRSRLSEAIDFLEEAIPKHDPLHQIASHTYEFLNTAKSYCDHGDIAIQIDRLTDHFVTNDGGKGDPAYAILLLWAFIRIHATWRDSPLFDLRKASAFAEQSFQIARLKKYQDYCNSQQPGSGSRVLEEMGGACFALRESVEPASGDEFVRSMFADPSSRSRVLKNAGLLALQLGLDSK